MSTAVKMSEILVEKARLRAKVFKRSTASQIEYWAMIGEIAEENPDLTFADIQGILMGLEEYENKQIKPYKFSSE